MHPIYDMPPNNPDSLMTQIVDGSSNATSTGRGKRKLSDYNDSLVGAEMSATVDYGCMESSLRRMEHSSSRALNMEHAARFYASTILQDPQQFLMPRLERSYWKQLSTLAKEHIGVCLQELLNQKSKVPFWKFIGLTRDLPVFQCPTTQVQFTLIPGGNFRMGMSHSSQQQLHNCLLEHFRVSSLNELPLESSSSSSSSQVVQLLHNGQPVETAASCEVAPFLLATRPITCDQARLVLSSANDQENATYHNNFTAAPASGGGSFRLPTEGEWEYAARGGGWEMLFPYSCRIDKHMPRHDQLNHLGPRNAMGLHQVGARPELCTTCYGGGRNDSSCVHVQHATKVVARGGADVWSLIYYARPTNSSFLMEGSNGMMDCGNDEVVVRLALDIFTKDDNFGFY